MVEEGRVVKAVIRGEQAWTAAPHEALVGAAADGLAAG